jgi:hypothetical protein
MSVSQPAMKPEAPHSKAAGNDLRDWAVIGGIVCASSALMWALILVS